MFERYTEKARHTILFARREAGQFGSAYIASEHLLLRLMREDNSIANGRQPDNLRDIGVEPSRDIVRYYLAKVDLADQQVNLLSRLLDTRF